MKRQFWLPALMTVTILAITGFQGYWLKNNYDREERILNQKTNIAFRETVMKLQAENLKLDRIFRDSAGLFDIEFSKNGPNPLRLKLGHRESVAAMVSTIGEKVSDTLKRIKDFDSTFIISSEKSRPFPIKDSVRRITVVSEERPDDRVVRFLYSIDSLQDSVSLHSLDSAFSIRLQSEKLNVPFSISRGEPDSSRMETHKARFSPFGPGESAGIKEFPEPNKVTIGIIHPVTFELKLGSTFPYLLKRITSPVLFSLFLIGVTILSFVLLYRNLLKQRRLTELKNDFISNITHELKTPIATVGVAIEALQNFNAMNDPQRTKDYLDISQNELNRLSLLVDKVLKLSMFEKKELQLNKEHFNLEEIVREVANSFQPQMERKNAAYIIKTQGNDFTLFADKLHITSVVYNLIDNALKYTRQDPVIDIELNSGQEQVTLRVKDNGIGIPQEYKSKVFEKFFRVPSGDMHNVKGYGLGLSYAAQVIAKHKGSTTVESEPGKGSTFIITIPKTRETEKE